MADPLAKAAPNCHGTDANAGAYLRAGTDAPN